MIGALKYFATEAAISLWRGRRSSLLSVLTITLALFMLGLFLLVSTNLERIVGQWSRSAEFSVYLRDEVSTSERGAVEAVLKGEMGVGVVEFVSKAAALARFRREFPDLAAATQGAVDNPFPASFEVRVASLTLDAAGLEKLAARVVRMPGVSDVRYDRTWLDRLAALTRAIRWTGFFLAGLLIVAAALTVTNVVRLALFARRDEVEIMELVGAPLTYIRGPFVCEGIFQGGLGAALALGALRLGLALGRARLGALTLGVIDPAAIEYLASDTILAILAGGMAVGCVGGLVAARRLR